MSAFQEITELVNAVEIFDTHEHVAGFDWGFTPDDAPIGAAHPRLKSLPHLLMNDMLRYLIGSTGLESAHLAPENWQVEDALEYWRAIQPALEELRGTATYTLIRRGIKELHGFEGDEIGDENWESLNEKIVATYAEKGASQWLSEVASKAKIGAMIQMAHLPYLLDYWPSLELQRRTREKKLVRPALILEPLFFSGFEPGATAARERVMQILEMRPENYQQHLEWMHKALRRHKAAGGAAVKLLCAYQRSLHFEKVPDAEAQRLYAQGVSTLDGGQMARLQDNLVWHLVRGARDLELPVMIHTGYSTPSSLAHPETLFEMVRDVEFRSTDFYFCHAGWPHHGALALMARSFPNVHFGFCWIPGLSPALAARMFDEMVDLIPANKMLFGMDSGSIESFYGITSATREVIAKVLAAKVDADSISRRAASTLAHRVLHDNGAKLFLKEI